MGKTYRGLTRIGNTIEARSGIDGLQKKCNIMKSLYNEFYKFSGTDEELETIVDGLDTSPVKDFSGVFHSSSITKIPETFNFENAETLASFIAYCKNITQVNIQNLGKCESLNSFAYGGSGSPKSSLTSIRLSGLKVATNMSNFAYDGSYSHANLTEIIIDGDTSNVKSYSAAFRRLNKVITIKTLDLLNNTSAYEMFYECRALENLVLKNIKISLQIGSGSSWGHLLTLDSLLNTIKECWDMSSSTSKTLTVGTANKTKLTSVYVKLIDITDEMRAEDPYIDNKKPFVVCESTDEGAMLVEEYITSKNWVLA